MAYPSTSLGARKRQTKDLSRESACTSAWLGARERQIRLGFARSKKGLMSAANPQRDRLAGKKRSGTGTLSTEPRWRLTLKSTRGRLVRGTVEVQVAVEFLIAVTKSWGGQKPHPLKGTKGRALSVLTRASLRKKMRHLSCWGTHHSGRILLMRSFRTSGPHCG